MDHVTIPFHFAPLQGYTDFIYRNAHNKWFGGIDFYYTPFIRIEKGRFRNKDLRDIDPENNETNLVPQLIGSEPGELERMINLLIDFGYKRIDLNWGCPFPLITRKKLGAGILPHPDKIAATGTIIEKYSHIQFSVKMRLGMECADESVQLLPIINNLPLIHIVMHPRTGKQQYKGTVDMEGFKRFYNECRHPMIYNGDIMNQTDISRIESDFPGIKGIMIGRGLLADPSLAYSYSNTSSHKPDDYTDKLYGFHQEVYNGYKRYLEGGDLQLINKMKVFWEYLLPDTDKKIKKAIRKSTSSDGYLAIIENYFSGLRV